MEKFEIETDKFGYILFVSVVYAYIMLVLVNRQSEQFLN